ncbi:hypothetical protein [Bosea sp. PAMC 26642]|uniref:hypothetical protein n=1 Tax=Bosea sp. (strain PAMC 26642) TaxID=1792307 RepID=UPI000770304C|nr:hypothetical protein [Bosea sp. PAMC 26642]AMJ59356.1 hypothetical protein AXW83_02700 [Bosea sp. PAMC 26642]
MAKRFEIATLAVLAAVALSCGSGLAQQLMPPAVVTVSNARTVPLTSLEIATPDEPRRVVASLARPLAPGGTVGLRLNRPAGCSYKVQAHFDDTTRSEPVPMDLCKDKIIRLTE